VFLDITAAGDDGVLKGANGDGRRSRTLNLSDLSLYRWNDRGGGVRSLLRTSSLTDASGPHKRNVSTNLLDELAAADEYVDTNVDVVGSSSESTSVASLEDKNDSVEFIETDSSGEGEGDVDGEKGTNYVVAEGLNEIPTDGDEGWWTLGRGSGRKMMGGMMGIGRRGSVTGKSRDRKKKRRKFRLGKWVRKAIKRTKSEFFRTRMQVLLTRDKVKKASQKRAEPV
jgi:hypothetical protein